MNISEEVGAVVIGRNEGERLKTCLTSLQKQLAHIVYVDSGSNDQSVEFANSINVDVVALDLSQPFTAARARNSGFDFLIKQVPEIKYVQFIDGDCELQQSWLKPAFAFLNENDDFAVTTGRRRERFPEVSLYNLLCDIEWDSAVGEVKACGGDSLIRVSAFKQVEGFREDLIAGEEPEMCFRLRKNKWKIMRLDEEMTLHDAAMHKISQWWKRHKRAGHAYTESYALHGRDSEMFRAKEVKSILFWGALFPFCLLLAGCFQAGALILFMLYPIQVFRLALRDLSRYNTFSISLLVAANNIFAKFPQFTGMIMFVWNRVLAKKVALIEYK
jgi:glycosyltransferase involved in cell wall biosynthesis